MKKKKKRGTELDFGVRHLEKLASIVSAACSSCHDACISKFVHVFVCVNTYIFIVCRGIAEKRI